MFPYSPQTPEETAALNAEITKLAKAFWRGFTLPYRWTWRQIVRGWDWITMKDVPIGCDAYMYVPSMGHGGLGGYFPRQEGCTNPGCGCGGQRERWDLPPMREPMDAVEEADLAMAAAMPVREYPVVMGAAITPELQRLFGYWGKVTGVSVDFDGNIDAVYEGGFKITFIGVAVHDRV